MWFSGNAVHRYSTSGGQEAFFEGRVHACTVPGSRWAARMTSNGGERERTRTDATPVQRLGRAPTTSEIATDPTDVVEAIVVGKCQSTLLDRPPVGGDDDKPLSDTLSHTDTRLDHEILDSLARCLTNFRR